MRNRRAASVPSRLRNLGVHVDSAERRTASNMAPGDLGCAQVTQASTHNDTNLVYAFEGCGRYVIYRCVWSNGRGAQCRTAAIGDGRAWDDREH